MAKLIIYSGTPQAREFALKPGTNQVGRGEDNDIQIPDPSVSTHHAQVVVNGGSIQVKDLNSTNGTFVNQTQVSEITLLPGQSLRLGGVQITFQMEGAAVPPPPPAIPPPPAPVTARAGLKISGMHHAEETSVPLPPIPPPPTPATARAGLKLSGVHHAEEPASPPPAAEAAPTTAGGEPAFVEPPPGKVFCKFHPKIAGQWFCRKCNALFCSLCVANKPTDGRMIHVCRKCGGECLPVKSKLTQKKEKSAVVYSDGILLTRSIGFGGIGALLGAGIWIGLSALFGFDVPFLFAPLVGLLCGFAVKFGCQDTPGAVFSVIAVVWCVIGSVLGKVGMIAVTHLTINTNTTYITGGLGILLAMFAAWRVGGDS